MKHVVVRTDQKYWVLPGDLLSIDEFKSGIKEAEKGPFYSIQESKKMIAQWREQRNSK